jgi:hypothetical protein
LHPFTGVAQVHFFGWGIHKLRTNEEWILNFKLNRKIFNLVFMTCQF